MRVAELKLKFEPSEAKILYEALKPETESTIAHNCEVSIKLGCGGEVFLRVKADSTSTLRALINAYLLWIHSIVETLRGCKLGRESST